MQNRRIRGATGAVGWVALVIVGRIAGAATTATWTTPGDGNWSDASRWSTNPYYPNKDNPAGATYDVVIPAGAAGYDVAMADVAVTVGNVENRATVAARSPRAGGGSYSLLPTTFQNFGKLEVSGGAAATVRNVQNSGIIRADGGELTLTGTNKALAGGSMAAVNGGRLILFAGSFDNAGSMITADGAGSPILVNKGGSISNGTVTTTNGAQVVNDASFGTLSNLTLNGRAVGKSTLYLDNVTLNAGRMEVVGFVGLGRDGAVPANVTLNGTGEVVFDRAPSPIAAPTPSLNVGGLTTTLVPGITVRTGQSSGRFTYNLNANLVSNGTISAEGTGKRLDVGRITSNSGATLRARDGGTLALNDAWRSYGAMRAETGGKIEFNATGQASYFANDGGRLAVAAGVSFSQMTGWSNAGDVTLGSGAEINALEGLDWQSGTLTGTQASVKTGYRLRVFGGLTCDGTGTLETRSLLLSPGHSVDLGRWSLRVPHGASAFDPEPVVSLLRGGYNEGRWDGVGLRSAEAARDGQHATALGWKDSSTALDVKYTWVGDANLDGVVSAADASLISAAGTTWPSGDFNYDGRVTSDDYALFALGAAVGTQPISAVPEPACVAAITLGSAANALRRRVR